MKLSELLERDIYQKADGDKKRLILEDWYGRTIKQDPNYDPVSDSSIREIVFNDVPPTHIQETPSLLQELPKALGEVFLPKPKPEPYEPPEGAIRAWEPRTIGEKVSSAIADFAEVSRFDVSRGFRSEPGALVKTAFEPFQRVFEHTLANVATEIQETGTVSPISLLKAGTAPIRKIKLEPEERKMLGDIFRNYNESLTQVTGVKTPKIDEISAATGGLALRLLMPDVYRATKGVIAKGAKQKLFERTLKTVNTKLKKAGYEDEFIKIFREDLNKALSKSTVQREVNRYIKAQKFRPEVKGPKIAGPKAPIKPTKAIEAFKPVVKAKALPKSGVAKVKPSLEAFKPKEVTPKVPVKPVSLEAEAKKAVAEGKTKEEFVKSEEKKFVQKFRLKGREEFNIDEIRAVKSGDKPAHYNAIEDKKAIDYAESELGLKVFENITPSGDYIVVNNTAGGKRIAGELIRLSKQREAIFKTKDEERINEWNDKFSKLLGYSKDLIKTISGISGRGDLSLEAKRIFGYKKSQLTAIYEQAHKPPVKPEVKAFEPKKAKVEAFKPREPKVKAEILPEGEISIPVKKPVYKPTQTLSGEVKAKLKEQKGAVVIAGEPLKAVKTTMDKVADVFTRYRNIDDITREQFVAIEELAPKKMEDAADLAMQTVGNKFDKATRRKIQLAMDNPSKYTLPKGTEKAAEEIDKIQKLHNQTLKEAGFDISEWPQGKIKYLEEQIPELETKLKTLKTDKAKGNTKEKIDATKKEIEQLKGLGYVHRISRKTLVGKIRGATKLRSISTKPVKFLGRHYNTIEEAEKAGIIVGDITESVGETIYSIWKTGETKNLIDAINKNKNYTLPTDKAPSDWESIDTRVLPSAKGKKYHPAMAGAIKELTYVSRDVNALVRAYDNLNTTGKMIGFYNPVFMTNYDIQQGWRAAGMKFFTEIPSAIKTYAAKDDKYYQLMKEGIFNKVIDYKPGVDVMVKQMLDMAEKSYGKRFAEKIGDVLLHPVKGLQIFNNKTTWAMDEILRIAAREGIKNQRVTKGLSSFQITDLANDFMAAYNKLPKATKKTLNRVIFTPTYKISMARILGKMHTNPKQFTAPLIRHHAFKLFLKFVLPTVVGSYVANKYKDEITKVYSEKGYRLVVKIGDKVEKVYAITGPLLEETKIAHRKLAYTLKLNLSFGLNMLNTFLNRNKGYSEPDDLKRINEYFKIGAPGIREYQNWTDKDKATADKFLSQLGFAYAYTRLPSAKEPDKRNIFIKALSAMDLWLDWRDKEETRELKEVERRYRWYSDKLYRAIKRKDNPEIRELMEKSRKEFGKYYPIKNVEARIAREKRVKKPWLTRGEQQLEAKNKFIQGVIREK